jgi:hypothetical protein
MTTDRSCAYARVTKTVADLGPAKLHDLEQRRVRHAADALVFAGAHDFEALAALDDIEQLMQELISCGRWTPQRAGRLADDVAACGPACVYGHIASRAA